MLLATAIGPAPVCAQEHIPLPPVNLGGSSFKDGVGGPGLLVREALGAFVAPGFADASGATVPGQNTLSVCASTTLVAYMPPFKVLGGRWGVEILVAGYFLRQITDSKANGQSVSSSQERVAALGPGFLASVGTLEFVANVYCEFAVDNRPRGTRASAVIMNVW